MTKLLDKHPQLAFVVPALVLAVVHFVVHFQF